MRVFEATEANCMKALEKILSEQDARELISKAAEITIEIEGKVNILEGQEVMHYVQDIVQEDAGVKFRVEPIETQGEKAQLVILLKEMSLLKQAEKKFKKISEMWQMMI